MIVADRVPDDHTTETNRGMLMIKGLRLIALGLPLSLAIGLAGGVARADPQMIEVRTPHFTVYSELGEAKTREFVEDARRFEAVIALLVPGIDLSPPSPTRVYLLSMSTLDSISPSDMPQSYAFAAQLPFDGFYVVNLPSDWQRGYETFHYLYLQDLLRADGPLQTPEWYQLGLAILLESTAFTKDGAVVGKAPADEWDTLGESDWIPLQQVFAAALDMKPPLPIKEWRSYRRQSWALLHYATLESPPTMQAVSKYLVAWRNGQPQDAAFQAAFGTSYEELGKSLRAYVNQSQHRFVTIPYERLALGDPWRVTVFDLDERARNLVLGDFVLRSGRTSRKCTEFFKRVLAKEPADRQAIGGQAVCLARDGKAAEGRALLEGALQGTPDDPSLRKALVQVMPYEQPRRARTAADRLETRRLLEPVVRTEPNAYDALFEYAWTFEADQADDSLALSRLEEALARMPRNIDLWHARAMLNTRDGNVPGAREAWSEVLRLAPTSAARDMARGKIAEIDAKTTAAPADASH